MIYIIKIFHNFYCIFDQINAALVSISDFFQKHEKNINSNIFPIFMQYRSF